MAKDIWRSIQLSKRELRLSYMFFDDDLVLFTEASVEQVIVINNCLDNFIQLWVRKLVNPSLEYIVLKMSLSLSKAINSNFGCLFTSDLGKYLGMPLVNS